MGKLDGSRMVPSVPGEVAGRPLPPARASGAPGMARATDVPSGPIRAASSGPWAARSESGPPRRKIIPDDLLPRVGLVYALWRAKARAGGRHHDRGDEDRNGLGIAEWTTLLGLHRGLGEGASPTNPLESTRHASSP